MKKYLSILCIIALCCSMLIGCQQKNDNPQPTAPSISNETTNPSEPTEPTEIGANASKMEFDTYVLDAAYEATKGNTMFSPLSLDMALGMVAEGAGSEYQSLFVKLLGKDNYAEFASQYMEYLENLNKDVDNNYEKYKTVFEIANSVWVNQQYMPVENFENKLKSFSAELNTLNFEEVSNTVFQINNWCKEKTHDMIDSVVSEENFNDTTKTVIVNAVYFESPWVEPWLVSKNNNNFTLFDGATIEHKMIETFTSTYYENEYATAFGYQYVNGLTFIGILPKTEGEFDLSDLDISSLLETQTYQYDVNAKMPVFKFENRIENLVQILTNSGYGILFDANMGIFSQMLKNKYGNAELHISDIIQVDAIELDENGTKAAAVTAIVMDTNGVIMPKETKEVILNRPFAFLIYDSEMNQVVFMGKVVNPA